MFGSVEQCLGEFPLLPEGKTLKDTEVGEKKAELGRVGMTDKGLGSSRGAGKILGCLSLR